MARSQAAEAQALRLLRQQQEGNAPAESAGRPQPIAEMQEISRQGLIGSRRLASGLEGMLRDKPKFTARESARKAAPTVETPGATTRHPLPVFRPFQAGPEPLSDPRLRTRPMQAAEDPESGDLNLSSQNLESARQTGLPATQTMQVATQVVSGPLSPSSRVA
jgi:hypothetical protein